MIPEVRYFHEKTNQDYETYNKLWHEKREHIVYLQLNLSDKQQLNDIINNLNDNKDILDNKNILAIRFPTKNELKRNKIINNILLGNGVRYQKDKIWYPKEMWIYNPIN